MREPAQKQAVDIPPQPVPTIRPPTPQAWPSTPPINNLDLGGPPTYHPGSNLPNRLDHRAHVVHACRLRSADSPDGLIRENDRRVEGNRAQDALDLRRELAHRLADGHAQRISTLEVRLLDLPDAHQRHHARLRHRRGFQGGRLVRLGQQPAALRVVQLHDTAPQGG